MDIVHKLGKNSAIYIATNLLQKGSAFLLMPLYTLYLDPSAYGVLAIVTAVNGLLAIAFTLGLTGAVTRFYIEYQNEPEKLREFWGSILSFVVLLSTVVGGAMFLCGETLLRPIIGSIAFWPYIALGIFATFFQPFVATFLALLQTRNQAGRYAVVSLLQFGITTLLTIALVMFLGWGVVGALVAALVAAVLSFGLSLWMLRTDLKLCLRLEYLRRALGYSLPQLPHALASQVSAITDRVIINGQLGTAAAGLYSVGAMVALVVEVAAQSVNRAYVPLGMAALKRGQQQDLDELRSIGALIVGAFCLLGVAVGSFGHEIVRLLASPAFAGATEVIPLLVFAGVASAIYYVVVNALFYDFRAIRFLPVATVCAAVLNVALSLTLVPIWGILGAALATLLAQVSATLLVAAVGRRFDPVRWDYGRYALAFGLSLIFTVWLARQDLGGLAQAMAIKSGAVAVWTVVLGTLLWSRPLIFVEAARRVLARRPREAVALFALHRKVAS